MSVLFRLSSTSPYGATWVQNSEIVQSGRGASPQWSIASDRSLRTRGTHTTRIHTTDPATHHFLNQIFQPS